jgi:hypothetical protein
LTNNNTVISVYRPRDTLQAAGVPKIYVDNPEVGHGADHTEIAVMYEWLDRWNDPTTGGPPPGGTELPFVYTYLLRQRTTSMVSHEILPTLRTFAHVASMVQMLHGKF